MGSDLYDVTVLSTQDASVSLAVEVVYPDAMHLPEDPSFALMMLRECATPDAPLAREVAFEDLHDTTWVAKFTTGFVAGVHVHDVQQTSRTMRGIVDITVTHPAWVAHLARGQRWSSRAFDVAQRYDVHPPIAPCERHGTVAAEVAFVWVPREVFLPYRAPQSIPSLLEAPAYSPSAYEVSHEVREHFEQCVGRAVVVRTRDRELHGALAAVVDRRVAVAHLSRGARGVNWLEPQSVGLLAPAARRRGTRLSMTEVLAVTPVTATYIGADGAHVELSVRVPPDGRAVPIASETDVLDLLVWPLRESAFGELVDSELARALRADLDARGMEGAHRLEEIYPQIARRYVAGFRVEAVPFDVPAWHELS
ncbi:MAG TPA: hypothetical protein VK427_24030, partial [Kofleriaceae bacterium]|nr:hypothetical protein [Kofleriaceae bacterium]